MNTLNAAEKFQHWAGAIGAPIVRALAGSSSPNYVQLQWRKQEHLDPAELNTQTVNGDPAAGRLPRFWQKALLLFVQRDELAEITSEQESRQAVVYVSHSIARVGLFPENRGFGPISDGSSTYLSVAMRRGRGPLTAAMGMWLPKEKEFVAPLNYVRFEDVSELSSKYYSKTPLV